MKIIKSITEIDVENLFVTVGNFDGVHQGHQEFLAQIKAMAKKSNAQVLVMTFVPHPLIILKGLEGHLINSYDERRELLNGHGVDFLAELNFNRDFSTISPEEFLAKYVWTSPKVKKVFLGHDFAFGANKSGGHDLAKSLCESRGIEVVIQDQYLVEGAKVSSSAVRENLLAGNVELANKLLGRQFFITGRVVKGEGRGRKIGFPTANIFVERERVIPSNGVYITITKMKDLEFHSLTNIGFNPTFNDGKTIHVETHVLDFNQDIYGDEIVVRFVKKLRDEIKFSSVNDLINQIGTDVKAAREFYQ